MQRKWVKRMVLATLFLGGGALFPAGQQALAQDATATTGRSYAVLMGDEDVTLSGYKTPMSIFGSMRRRLRIS